MMLCRAWVCVRLFTVLLLATPAVGATRSSAGTGIADVTGNWLFDDAPSYPGVTMMQVEHRSGRFAGTLTTAWYGPIEMRNATLSGDTLVFDVRNLNDPSHPTQRWTARFAGGGVRLVGKLWHEQTAQTGKRGGAAAAAARTFRMAPPLPTIVTLSDDGLARTPPMGWSSWNTFADRIDDATIRAMADAMVSSGLRDAGYVYVNVDDGWQGIRDAAGVLHSNAKFPDMKALADYVHAKGLKFGLYSSPGPRTCAGYAGSYGHIAQDAKTFAAWGVDYIKYDLCSGEWFYADADSVRRAYYEMGAALRATGRPIVYSLCEYGRFDVADWGRTVGGHLWRTTGDIADDYKTMSEIGFERNPKFPHGGPGGWNDPDMLEIGNGGMTVDEYRTHMTLWAIQAAPLLMGHDLRNTTSSAAAILKHPELIAIDQDALGAQGRPIDRAGGIELWRRPLAGGAVAWALFNRTDRAAAVALPDEALTGRAVLDVWERRDLVPAQRALTVPAHGTVLLRLAPGL